MTWLKNIGFAFLTGLACASGAQGQSTPGQIHVNGGFLTDSVHVGDQVQYYLSVHYPRQGTVLFPDSLFSFAPFEFNEKHFFSTRTSGGMSKDSAVYVLDVYEVDPIQYLSLPVFLLSQGDSNAIPSPRDSVFLSSYVKVLPHVPEAQSLPLKTETAYQPVSFLFNYPMALMALGGGTVTLTLLWIVFGKRIKRMLRVRKLKQAYRAFQRDYAISLQEVRSSPSANQAERTLLIWKEYMENLKGTPYTKLTSRELATLEKNQSLEQDLQSIDRAIYGQQRPEALPSFERLLGLAESTFLNTIEHVRHGQ